MPPHDNRLSRISLKASATLIEAMSAMEGKPKYEHPPGIVLVVDDGDKLLGVASDGDLRRAILAGRSLEEPLESIMTRDPITIPAEEMQAGSFGTFIRRARESGRMMDPATGRVIVVDGERRAVDIVPLLDLLIRHEMDSVFAVVLAGGAGTRLWPLSRKRRPKQFLDLTGEGSMLRVTISRLERLIPIDRILVVTTPEQRDMVCTEVPTLPSQNLLIEPSKRGTAPCVALAALHLEQLAPDATMLVLPADHLIIGLEKYLAALSKACFVAATSRQQPLMTIGLKPAFASTAYGYLELGEGFKEPHFDGSRAVSRFVEKPTLDRAKEMVEAGGYLWNTGTFAWTVRAFRQTVARCVPEFSAALDKLALVLSRRDQADTAFADAYAALPDISVDYAIMERADNVAVVEAEFDRVDVGDLRSLARLLPADDEGNVLSDRSIARNGGGNIIYSPGRLTAVLGIRDTIIVVTDDVVLVCAKDHAQDVLSIVHTLHATGATNYV